MYGEKIKTLRKSNNLTQAQLAEKLNCSVSKVGMWETDKREPTKNDLVSLADIFNVSINYLLDVEENTDLNNKDKEDLAKSLDNAIKMINNENDSLLFSGKVLNLDEETKELLISSLEQSIKIGKALTSKKKK